MVDTSSLPTTPLPWKDLHLAQSAHGTNVPDPHNRVVGPLPRPCQPRFVHSRLNTPAIGEVSSLRPSIGKLVTHFARIRIRCTSLVISGAAGRRLLLSSGTLFPWCSGISRRCPSRARTAVAIDVIRLRERGMRRGSVRAVGARMVEQQAVERFGCFFGEPVADAPQGLEPVRPVAPPPCVLRCRRAERVVLRACALRSRVCHAGRSCSAASSNTAQPSSSVIATTSSTRCRCRVLGPQGRCPRCHDQPSYRLVGSLQSQGRLSRPRGPRPMVEPDAEFNYNQSGGRLPSLLRPRLMSSSTQETVNDRAQRRQSAFGPATDAEPGWRSSELRPRSSRLHRTHRKQ